MSVSRVFVFPNDDVLRERVREVLGDSTHVDEATRTILEERLRRVYPRVVVRLRNELAAFGDDAVYVFRDGSALGSFERADWIDDPGTARVVTDASGTYVDANEAAAALFGVPVERIVGRRAGQFTRPDVRVGDAAALWRHLAETGRLHSLTILSGSGADGTLTEFVTVRDGDGPGRNVTYMRALALAF